MAAYKGKKLADMKGAERDRRIRQLLANPGTRKYVPTADLPKNLQAKRNLNTRLNAPIVEGSPRTYRDLAHEREAAVTTQFGPNAVGSYQQREKDTGGWYDQYLAELEKHRQNVGAFQDQAQAQIANASTVQGGPAPVDAQNQGDAAKAQAIRDSILGAMKGRLAGQGRAANTYADTLAHVVAPGQKVQALTAARGATDELKAKQGAFRTQFESEAKTSESKDVLARQALTGKTAAQQAQDAIDAARLAETSRHNRASESNTAASRRDAAAQRAAAGDHYGYTNAQWAGMSPAQRRAAAKKWKAETGAGKGTSGAGPEWLTNQQMGEGLTQLTKLKDFANKAKSGQPFVPGHKPQGAMSRQDAAKKIFANAPSLKDPVLLSAALDAAYDGHLSAETVRRLIDAGYKPKRVAQTLGVPTAGQAKKKGPVKPKIPPLNLKPLQKP